MLTDRMIELEYGELDNDETDVSLPTPGASIKLTSLYSCAPDGQIQSRTYWLRA